MSADDTTPAPLPERTDSADSAVGARTTGAPDGPTGRRRGPGRRGAVLGGLVIAGLVAGSTRTSWATATAPDITGAVQTYPVTGADAAPAVLALSLVALAAAAATSLSSRWVRWVTGPVLALSGIGTVVAAAGMLGDPTAASAGAVADATGISGVELHATASAWPVAAIVGGALLALLGVLVLVVGGRWPRGSSRYSRATLAPRRVVDPEQDPAAAWDALSRGEDPTDPAEDAAGPEVDAEPAPAREHAGAAEGEVPASSDDPRHSAASGPAAGPADRGDPPAGVAQ